MAAAAPPKLTKAEAGRLGNLRRWGDPGVVRLDELTAPQRRLVLALVAAAKAENEKAASGGEVPMTADAGGTRDASPTP